MNNKKSKLYLVALKTLKNILKQNNEYKINVETNLNQIGIITEFKCLTYYSNSCRYDTFITFYIFYIFDYMNKIINKLNPIIYKIHNLIINIKKDFNRKNRDLLWKYFIDNKIDIFSTDINNKNSILENGYRVNGFIVQLFSIFKNNVNFNIKEKKKKYVRSVVSVMIMKKFFIIYLYK